MTKKHSYPRALWSVDLNYNIYEGEIDDPLYTICKIDNYYHVMYYGVSGMYGAETFDECKNWVTSQLEDFKVKRVEYHETQAERRRINKKYIQSLRDEGVI